MDIIIEITELRRPGSVVLFHSSLDFNCAIAGLKGYNLVGVLLYKLNRSLQIFIKIGPKMRGLPSPDVKC